MSKARKVGVTGGVGAGKSIICRIFSVLGVPVYDADSRARWLMDHHPLLRQEITKTFGPSAYDEGGLNRRYLATRVFNDSDRISELNKLVHPVVGDDFRDWVSANAAGQQYVIKEAALLIESGSYKELDTLIVVTAPESLRIQRVLDRDPHRKESEVRSIMAKQLPEEEKKNKGDYVIINDEAHMVIDQVLSIHKDLTN